VREIWNLSTPEFFVVEDFEDYNDYPPDEIWSTWIDGYGVPTNGATAGYPEPLDFLAGEHYMETTIVHGGSQSMPFFYDNTGGATYSECERTFAVPQDWTKAGVQTLGLWFHGTPGNTGQLYVEVNGSKVVYDGEASNLARAGWQAWNIEVASFGVDLQSVTTLGIGIDDNGASGTLYFDDIRLYPYSRQFITPVEPNNAGLVGHWKFDEVSGTIAYDSSGNGNDGTVQGDPQWVAGMIDSGALSFDGTDGYVEIGDDASLSMTDTLTITVWLNVPDLNAFYMLVCKQPSGTARDNYPGNYEFRIQANTGILEFGHQETEGEQFTLYTSDSSISVEQWYHVAVAVTKGEFVEFYIDGVAAGSAEQSTNFGVLNDNPVKIGSRTVLFSFFNGLLDDIRLYDYALSYGEVGWLAGRTEPFDKPF